MSVNIGEAIEHIDTPGAKATRAAWESNNAFITLDEAGLVSWGSEHHPLQVWHPDSGDLRATDWVLLDA